MKYEIPGLENCPPFIRYQYRVGYYLYTTKSLAGHSGWDNYIHPPHGERNWPAYYDVSAGMSCIGLMYSKMSEEEQELFSKNIKKIFSLLEISL
jgi:hypothetical protein